MGRQSAGLQRRRSSVGRWVEGLEDRQLLTGSATIVAIAGTVPAADSVPTPGTLPGVGVDFSARTGAPIAPTSLAHFTAPIAGSIGGATIDYGDGSPVENLVVSADSATSGGYTVVGAGHVYAHAGTYTVRATLTMGSLVGTAASTATVTDDANVPDGSIHGTGVDFSAKTGAPIAPTLLAHFTAPIAGSIGGATIDYGDGSPVENLVVSADSATGTVYNVNGAGHVYAHAGTYSVRATFTMGSLVGTAASTATVTDDANVPDGALRDTGVDIQAKTGDPLLGITLANFPAPIGGFGNPTVDYGDGTPPELGSLQFSDTPSGNVYVISAFGHTYAHAGTYTIHVTFTADGLTGTTTSTATVTDDANVPDGSIHSTGLDVVAEAGVPTADLPLARFSNTTLGSFTGPTIDYGDGTPATFGLWAEVPDDTYGHAYVVSDRGHVYAQPGIYTIRVTFTVNGVTGTATSTATVTGDPAANSPDGANGQAPATTVTVAPPASASGAPPSQVGPVAPAPVSAVPKWLAAFAAKVGAEGGALWVPYRAHPDGLNASRLKARGAVHHHGASAGHHPTAKVHVPATLPKTTA